MQARKFPKHEQKSPKTSVKTADLGKKAPPRQPCARQLQEPAQEPTAQAAQTLLEDTEKGKVG